MIIAPTCEKCGAILVHLKGENGAVFEVCINCGRYLGQETEAVTSKNANLRELQTNLPWTIRYHRDFRSNPQAHKDFEHALLHVFKAAGKLAAIVNDAEHKGHDFNHAEVAPYVADLVVCALRMANTCPNRTIDLQAAVEDRITTKNRLKQDAPAYLARRDRDEAQRDRDEADAREAARRDDHLSYGK